MIDQGSPDLLSRALAGLLAVSCLLHPPTAEAVKVSSQAKDDSLTIKFRASQDPAIREAQEALVQTWGYASTQFLEPNFNGIDWPRQLQVAFTSALHVKVLYLCIPRPS